MGRSSRFSAVLCLLVGALLSLSLPSALADGTRLERQEKLVVRVPKDPSVSTVSGNCSMTPVLLTVVTEADLYARLNIAPSTTVYMLLANSLSLTKPLNISGPEWACTSIRPLNAGADLLLMYPFDDRPAVMIWRTHNVFIYGIKIRMAATDTSQACKGLPDFAGSNTCPALFIWRSYGIKVSAGSVYGRTDVSASAAVQIDSMTLFAPGLQGGSAVSCPGVVRFLYCGDPAGLTRSGNVLSNSDISGNSIGVLMYYMTVGVTIRNNEIHNFSVNGIQCGMNVHNVADCMLNTITNNLIYTEPFVSYWGDGAGIYFDTHWVNPGNYLSCNQIRGGAHCIYLDYGSTGVRIDGGICENAHDGVKFNTGKYNIMTSMIVRNLTATAGLLSCQNPSANNCRKDPGSYWIQNYQTFYNTPAWNQLAPYLNKFCQQTSYNGFLCNPPNTLGSDATFTGNCSGLPIGNQLQYIIVDGNGMNLPYYAQCSNYTTVPNMNPVTTIPLTGALAGFDNLAAGDYGASNYQAPIYSSVPNFRSCPKSSIGIQRHAVLTLSQQMASFGMAEPPVMAATLAFKSVYKAHYRAAEFHDYKLLARN